MADRYCLEILERGVETWNTWRKKNFEIRPDLTGADLSEWSLANINLSDCILKNADLSGAWLPNSDIFAANLYKAKLSDAQLSSANLERANLDEAILNNTSLDHANLLGAYLNKAVLRETALISANLSYAEVEGADLGGSVFATTILAGLDLSQTLGLETTVHIGPSSIGIDTIFRSRGKIPEVFLHGAGVPENFIEYIPHLIEDAIQFYSCFISYSTKDQEFAERLHSDLQDNGVRCWFAPEDIKGGRKLHEQIPEAIRLYDKLLLVLSENSLNSEWVQTEIYHARQDEIRTGKRKLFPIGLIDFEEIRKWQAFDADVGKDMSREIREYFIPDFSDWKNHDSYKKAFDRLLRDLQAED